MAEEILREGGATRAKAAEAGDLMDTGPRDEIVGNTASLEKADEDNFADKTQTEQIQQLKEAQAEIKKAKRGAIKKLRNLPRQKKRLSVKARLSSDEDLVQVLRIRRAKAQQTSGSSKASSSHETPGEEE